MTICCLLWREIFVFPSPRVSEWQVGVRRTVWFIPVCQSSPHKKNIHRYITRKGISRDPTYIRNTSWGLSHGCVITRLQLLQQTKIGKDCFSKGLITRALTFMLHTHPDPLCVSVCVKLQSQWSCDEPKKSLGTVDLTDFLVCVRKKICSHVTWTRFWVIGNTILIHGRVFFKHWCHKGGPNLLTSQELIGIFHIQTYANKKTRRTMDFRVYTTHTVKWPDKIFGLVVSSVRW